MMPTIISVWSTASADNASQALAITTTTETVVQTLTMRGVKAGQNCCLLGTVTQTSGGASTFITLRLRQTSLTGTIISPGQQQTVTAGAKQFSMEGAIDQAPNDDPTYVLTAQMTAATANSTVTESFLRGELSQ